MIMNPGETRPSTAERQPDRRRHPRLAVTLAASLIRPGLAELPCEIRDFCRAGLFLRLIESRPLSPMQSVAANTPVFVGFLPGGRGTARHILSGYVARIVEGGIGVALDTMPEDAFRALSDLALSSKPHEPGRLSEAQSRALRQQCQRALYGALETVLYEFFQGIGGTLNDAADASDSMLQRSLYLGAINQIQGQSQILRGTFLDFVELGFDHPDTHAHEERPGMTEELALIETEKFEDWLTLTGVINHLEMKLDGRLTELEQRYATLTGLPVSRKNLPFGPDVICRSWQRALDALRPDPALKKVYYKAFGEVLKKRIEAFYGELENILAPVPYEKPTLKGVRMAERPAAVRPASGETLRRADQEKEYQAAAAEIDKLYRAASNEDTEHAGGEYSDYQLNRILARLTRALRQSADAEPPDLAPPLMAAGYPARTMPPLPVSPSRVAGDLLEACRTPPHTPGTPAVLRPPNAREASPSQLLAAFGGLSFDQAAGAIPLQSRVRSQIAGDTGEAVTLGVRHQHTLNTVEALLGRAAEEQSLAGDLRTLLGQMARPLYKLAVTDEQFLTDPAHPARKVIDLLDQFSITADDKGRLTDQRLLKLLHRLVERLSAQDAPDAQSFAEAQGYLEELLDPILQTRASRIARLQEISESRHRIGKNKVRIDQILHRRLVNREVPEIVLRLLQKGWHHHLVLLSIQEGFDSTAWRDGIEVIERLTDWLSPEYEPSRTDIGDAQEILRRVEEALRRVSIDVGQEHGLLDDLGMAVMGRLQGKIDTVPARQWLPPDKVEAGQEEESQLSPILEKVRNIRVSDWYQFTIRERTLPLQLIWASSEGDSYVFTNRSVTRKLELNRENLSRQLHSGLTERIESMDLPLMERSENKVIQDAFERIQHNATHDPASGLLNRKGFLQELHRVLGEASRPDSQHALCVLEFDQFRTIYNSCGSEAGDSLLRTLSAEMQTLLRKTDLIAHINEGTFGILLANCAASEGCDIAGQLLGQLKDFSFQHGDKRYTLGLNIGLVEFSEMPGDEGSLLSQADSACLAAKNLGRNQMQIYGMASTQLKAQESLQEWAGRIDRILKEGHLYLRGQMISPINGSGGLRPHYEILLGVHDDAGGEIGPTEFILAAENWRRMPEVDLWTLRRVFEWIRGNREAFDQIGGFSVNLSGLSLHTRDVLDYLLEQLAGGDLPTEKISFEITETATLSGFAAAQEFIREIRRYGCKFSLDDFGSGFSTYSYLRNLSVDYLKIDGAFVKDLVNSPTDLAMVKSMNEIGHSLNMRTIAEYAESQEIIDILRDIGVDYAQGYAVQKPVSLDELVSTLEPAKARMAG